MFRRDFLALSAASLSTPQPTKPSLEQALIDLETAIAAEMPDATVRVYLDRAEPKVPLMVHAIRC